MSASIPPEAVAYARQFFDQARQGNLQAFEAPLKAGLPPNLRNDNGDTWLMLAAYRGHTALVKLLLEHGADPNILNDRGQSVLSGAVFKNEKEIIELLIQGGADPFIGTPNAYDTANTFKNLDVWRDLFENAPGRSKTSESQT